MSRTITTREVSEGVFKKFLADHPELVARGTRHVQPIPLGNQKLIWNKPMAYTERGKFFIIEEA